MLDEGVMGVIFQVGDVVWGAGEEGVDGGHLLAGGQEGVGQVGAEEAGAAGDQVAEVVCGGGKSHKLLNPR
jgi:hypothetical protein